MSNTDFSRCLVASKTIRIPFHDLDPAGVVWHGRYFKYFECARCALLESISYNYEEMKKSGYLWPVVDTNVRFVRPLMLNQEVCVTAHLSEWELRMVVNYRIEDEQGFVCTKARTVQVPVDAKTLELRLGCPNVFIENVQKGLLTQFGHAN